MGCRAIPQEMRAESTIDNQTKVITSKIVKMLELDIAGNDYQTMANILGLSRERIIDIKNSPLYEQRLKELQEKAQNEVITRLKHMATKAVDTYESILDEGTSEAVRKLTADAVLDRIGIAPPKERTVVTVQMTDRVASRIERVMGRSDRPEERESSGHRGLEEEESQEPV